jgi:hypothetical protein
VEGVVDVPRLLELVPFVDVKRVVVDACTLAEVAPNKARRKGDFFFAIIYAVLAYPFSLAESSILVLALFPFVVWKSKTEQTTGKIEEEKRESDGVRGDKIKKRRQ